MDNVTWANSFYNLIERKCHMLKTVIKENSYKDSVVLMLLTNEVSNLEGVKRASIMMATPANKDIFNQSGLLTPEVENAKADDIAIVMEVEDESVEKLVLETVSAFLNQSSQKRGSETQTTVRSWNQALDMMPDANLAVLSIPGIYAYDEANAALDLGLNVFIFSDNVSIEDELKLKTKAHEKGLLVMGPDSGTGIISHIPIAFTNKVSQGNIGIVGASGTGIQEVTTLIDKKGSGVTSAIGTGGRDLHESIGGITMLDGLRHLKDRNDTDVLVLISKPPAPSVKTKIENYIRSFDKPVVTLFLGNKPMHHEENIYHAYTLEEAALAAVAFSKGENPFELNLNRPAQNTIPSLQGKTIKGYYSGGTLASEAAMLIQDVLGLSNESNTKAGYLLDVNGFEIIDMGDDKFTQGRPHPMIDPHMRIEAMEHAMEDVNTGIILFDVVLGYGSHPNMAEALAPTILNLTEQAKRENRTIQFIATVCGTNQDPQNLREQTQILENLGVFVAESNAHAVISALQYLGHNFEYEPRPHKLIPKEFVHEDHESDGITQLLASTPKIINVGLQSFTDNLSDAGVTPVQFDWRPVAGGDPELMRTLRFLNNFVFEEESA